MSIVYQNMDTFLVELIGFPNHCDLRCSYCDWSKQPYRALTEQELAKVREHLLAARTLIERHYPCAQVIEYSGGEPYAHPEVVDIVLDVFRSYWVRINTNGLHITEHVLESLERHGKVYLAVSLDGHTLESNCYRLHMEEQLETIVMGIDAALNHGVPIALLCTIHDSNIDSFPDYIRWLTQRWPSFIRRGRLMIAAHLLSSYDKPRPFSSFAQREQLEKDLSDMNEDLVARISEHYQAMIRRDRSCGIHRWAASMHFLGDELSTTGRFTSYRCGMRGVGCIGTFDVLSELKQDHFSEAVRISSQTSFETYKCGCFVDWMAFDLIFSGVIPLDRAQSWFAVFQDECVRQWVLDRLPESAEHHNKVKEEQEQKV